MDEDARTGEEASLKFQRMVEENRQQYQRGIKLLAELIYKKVQENAVPSLSLIAPEPQRCIKLE